MHRLRLALVGLVLLGCSGSEGSTPPGGNSGGSTSTGGSGGIAGGTGGGQGDGGPDASSGGTSGTAGSPTGGSGGTSGTGGSGGTTSSCTAGEKKCLGSTAQHCNSSGTWDDQVCSTACIAGDCTACVPGSSDCQGNVPRSCDGTGNWIAGASCSGQTPVCLSGSCVSCSPSSTQCSGTIAQSCNSTGFWQTAQTCPYVCSGGTCIGSCVPTAKKCSGLNVETCDSTGTWQFTQTCPTACNSGSCGSCVNGSTQCNGLDAQSCNASGQWVTTTTCPYVCSSGSCTGSCVPGSTQCSGTTVQTCNSSGQWANGVTCPYVCASGACTGSCVPSSKKCVGNVPQTCDGTGTWQSGATCPFVCSGGSCTGVCVPGSTQCSGSQIQTCDGTGQWGLASSCPAVPGGTSTCSGGTCTFTCSSGYADCTSAAGCETQLGTSANCLACGDQCDNIPGVGLSPCISKGCQWKILATDTSPNVTDLALSTTDVYWSAYDPTVPGWAANINRASKSGSVLTPVWNWTGGPAGALVGDSAEVAWYSGGGASSSGIYKGITTGAGPTFVASVNPSLAVTPAALAMDATYFYWIVRSASGAPDLTCNHGSPPCTCTSGVQGGVSSTVWRAKRTGGAASVLVTVPAFLSSIAINQFGSVFATSYGPWAASGSSCDYYYGEVLSLAPGSYGSLANQVHWPGGNGIPLGDYSIYWPQTLVASGSNLFFSSGPGGVLSQTHYFFKVAGASPASLVSSDSAMVPSGYGGNRVVTDGTSLLWGGSSYGAIRQVLLTNGTSGNLFPGLAPGCATGTGGIVADVSAVYWTQQKSSPASCSGLATPATVMRALIP